ncbi:MAG: hypothetical protein CVU54_02020 [Deltaproteobacteria bacterium HGW-Deltaproteobacteria-12]|jgi:hypothetical protein|nr:MAG: hypothetical protein CVU54_02020 [Deltaproteobacteria bacterium HGW-Deltaproteobacteria-12]
MNLIDIEKLTKTFADARQLLADRVRGLEEELQTIKRRRMPGIRSAVNTVMEHHVELKAAVEESSSLFIRPKTIILHGVKVGFQKAKGKLSWNDDAQVVRLIKKHFPDQEDILIKKTEKPSKDALMNLPAADLKKIGVTVNETGDQVVIKSTDSEIDKFVDALLKEENPEGKAEEAA